MAEFDFKMMDASGSFLETRRGIVILASLVEGSMTTYLTVPKDLMSKMQTLKVPNALTGSLVVEKTATFASSGSVTVD